MKSVFYELRDRDTFCSASVADFSSTCPSCASRVENGYVDVHISTVECSNRYDIHDVPLLMTCEYCSTVSEDPDHRDVKKYYISP